MKTLYLMVGIPGSGKSTYIMNNKSTNSAWISRDDIRKALCLSNDNHFSKDNYFRYEKEVFKIYVDTINEAIHNEDVSEIYADATHINETSRNRLLNKLDLNGINVIPIVFNTSINICLKRNNLRSGMAKIPKSAIYDMYHHFSNPKNDLTYSYFDIIEVN